MGFAKWNQDAVGGRDKPPKEENHNKGTQCTIIGRNGIAF